MTRDDDVELLALLEEREKREASARLSITGLSRAQCNALYAEIMASGNEHAQRRLCREDLFFLLTVACRRKDVDHDWLFERCREVQANPNGYLDLWPRDHYKSTIITFGKSIQDVLCDPEVTIGIFSHKRPIAKAFLEQIKRELETNAFLQGLFPDILYARPQDEADKWSLDSGIIVKRKTNPKEATIEAHGLVDGQPTATHFKIRVYDDVVTLESVSTPEQILKVTTALQMSYNLGTKGGWQRFIGTRYHLSDSYDVVMKAGTAIPRIYKATDNGKMPPEGKPVFLTEEQLATKRRDMGPYVYGSQMNQDPVADRAMSFKTEWLRYYDGTLDASKWNRYLIVDPASKKKPNSDYTVMIVIALAPDNNYYVIAAIRDRLNLTARAAKLFELHREHQPKIVGYESYGMQADVEHIQYEMNHRNYRFEIRELGGQVAKEDRIKRLIPICEQNRLYLPRRYSFVDYEGRTRDFVRLFVDEEYAAFPVCAHDDMLDDLARVLDPELGAEFPKTQPKPQRHGGGGKPGGWMG